MPARDMFHQTVCNALVKDGWVITHDPLTLSIGGPDVFVDLGAERPIAAEKAGRRIAVEIKSFIGASDVTDLSRALGAFVLYRTLLTVSDPERQLYLAIPKRAYHGILSERIGQLVVADQSVALLVFDPAQEVIVKWLPTP